jgi:hypothetical protein
LELVLLAPALAVAMVLVAWAARVGHATVLVHQAADRAARSASLASRAHMDHVAAVAAAEEVAGNGVACQGPQVVVETNAESVAVRVRCRVVMTGLVGFPAPLVTGQATQPIDRYRAP